MLFFLFLGNNQFFSSFFPHMTIKILDFSSASVKIEVRERCTPQPSRQEENHVEI